MHIWTITDWEKNLPDNSLRRTGLRFRYDRNTHPEVKRACLQFAIWLRTQYYFPLRVVVYVKRTKTIRTKDGDHVVGSFFEPFSYLDEPYIRIATGDYNELANHLGKDNALASILLSLAHELTHYYQWINNIQLTPMGRERQATKYANYIIDEYASTREHPYGTQSAASRKECVGADDSVCPLRKGKRIPPTTHSRGHRTLSPPCKSPQIVLYHI